MIEEETCELLRDGNHGRKRVASGEDIKPSSNPNVDVFDSIKPHQWMLFSFLSGLIYGYNVSMAAPLQYIREDLHLSTHQQEMVSATATLSDATSMLVGGYLADRYGRKRTAILACCCSIIGAILSSLCSFSFSWLVWWRLWSGVGNGLSILILPMYISECVETQHRGTYLTLFQLGVNSGCAVPYLFMLLLTESWHACLAFGSVPALYIMYQLLVQFPESIRWIRWKQDLEPLEEVNVSTSDVQQPVVELLIGILLAYVNNCVDASLFYGPEIIAQMIPNFTRQDANLFGLLCSLLSAGSVLFAVSFLINKFSRRSLYLISLLIVTSTFLISGLIFTQYTTADFNHPSASISIIATFSIMNIFAAIGPSVLFVVILSELFTDSSHRARYMSYCTFSMSFISLVVNGTLLTLFETIGTPVTFVLYGISYGACLIFFWIYLPETKQRHLV